MRIIMGFKNILLNLAKTWGIFALLFALILGIPILYPNEMLHVEYIFSQNYLLCTIFRWCILAIIYGLWPSWIRKFGRRAGWSKEEIACWVKQRARVIAWLIFLEIVVNEQWLSVILTLWKS